MKHYLELTDGIRIEAFPKAEQTHHIVDNHLTVDTTGEYLQVGSRSKSQQVPHTPTAVQEQITLFLRYAHRLIAQSERILSDSRMFLAPVAIRNGLAYTGTSGFQNPTLGIYIEWWSKFESAWTEDEGGERYPIYYIAGSALSGCNACAYIDSNGNSQPISVNQFRKLWRSFMEVNNRYTEAKQIYEAYTLQDVVEILFGDSAECLK